MVVTTGGLGGGCWHLVGGARCCFTPYSAQGSLHCKALPGPHVSSARVRHCTQQVGCQLAAGHPMGELAKAAQEITLEGRLE